MSHPETSSLPEKPESGFALTPVQAGMIYETLANHDPAVNLEQIVLHLEDERWDEAAMRAAWGAAIARHPALRLSFRQGPNGHILQRVEPVFDAPLQAEDWTGLQSPDAALAHLLQSDRARGVDLSAGGSWRLIWLRLGPRRSVLIWTFSHAILDGRSFRQVLVEVFADYDGSGTAWPQAPDFGAHCRAVAKADKAPAQAFFQSYLRGFDRPTPLGFVHGPPVAADGTGATVLSAALTADQTRALTDRATAAGASFATMVQAAWGIVLARVAGQGDVVFGITRSGRYLTPQSRDMVGCLITTQPLRIAIGPQVTLDAVLAQIRQDLIAQRPYEGVGLADISAVTDIEAGKPLFDSLVMVERASLGAGLQSLGGTWARRRVDLREQGAMPLMLAAYGDAALQLRLEYAPGRIAAADAARYLSYLHRLLVAMAAAPEGALLADLSMLPEAEHADLLARAAPAVPIPAERPDCLATGFEAVVARQPEAPALTDVETGQSLSYLALDQRANAMAQRLAAKGIGPGDIVGLCLPRSADFVALILAAAKVGAAFLPMDPAYPSETLAHMASDSQLALIVSHAPLPWITDRAVLDLSADPVAEGGETAAPSRKGFDPGRAAYVIYTSGTTGKPKGVVVSQTSLVAHAFAAIGFYDLGVTDRALQFAALSFDVALEEIVPALLSGATLVLRDEAMTASPQAFVQVVAGQGISVLNLPTGFWQVLLGAMESGAAPLPPCVRLIVVGGERMPPDALARWQALPAVPRLINGYGPTEATITSAAFEPRGPVRGAEVPVGRAFGHALCYLLAPDRSLAPIGAEAELWLGGVAVATGYLNQPELTAQRFIPDRFAGQGRLYGSGDRAYWDAQGQITVLGRSDRQIKLRGYRIEPGEIEALLESLEGVAQAHVGLVDAGKPGARLVAWLRPSAPDRLPDLQSARAAVKAHLPSAKHPELVFVEDWPQTPGGKTDVKRLPVPRRIVPVASLGVADPQTARISDIFASVLGGEVPGPDDSFFDLGGHSLLLLTLIGHIEAAFSQRLSVAQVHAEPTPRGLSSLLSGPAKLGRGADLFDCLMPIQPLGTGVPIYGVHVLGVNGSFFRPLAQAMGLDQPIFGLTVGLLSADTPTSVEDIADLYYRVIQAHRPQGPVGLVAVSLGSYMALELARRLQAEGREVRMLAMMDAEGPGGRDKIRGFAWVQVHLRQLRRGGFGHGWALICAKARGLRHRLGRLWIAAKESLSQDAPVLNSVDGFVAANEVAIRNYEPQPYPGHMTIIRAASNAFDSDKAIAEGLGWASVAQGGFDVVSVPGDHLSILEEPGITQVAQAFATVLKQR
ncbi:amino acid adenylation domain-containing protein [Pseudorhodobacter sp. E13]|uniref:non-ribosomal peptide synthetase n=1 Tax=Pseudorhodobacter sp. E13 TaxID=2487931 RepID=UPI000F8E0FFB|nr:non-ribosomal peptide synthetase [Pseudorhodobacter sp. E13]RUS60627.1 amino acid adenylation domain-containing protein [Pseudorhodobacter sp. E13]